MSIRLWPSKSLQALVVGSTICLGIVGLRTIGAPSLSPKSHPLTGPIVNLSSQWVGRLQVSRSVPILVMAGHADSQGIEGAGTAGEAVDLKGAAPMDPTMRDELFWNLKVCDAVAKLGRQRGLNISFYDPGFRTILDEDDPRTNWAVGSLHARDGGYALEIHFDAYGKDGYGSGLIPAFSKNLNLVDESIAESFGRFPRLFRGGLGAPRRGIRILEIGKLEGELERKLRATDSREATLQAIALRLINALEKGLGRDEQAINPHSDEVLSLPSILELQISSE